jgi:hypothetical protein
MQVIDRPPTDRKVGNHLEIDVVGDQRAVDQHVDVDIRRELEVVRVQGRHLGKYAESQIRSTDRTEQQDASRQCHQKS